MKKKQIKLEVPSENATFYAISTSLSIHKLAWELNTNLQLKLTQGVGVKHLEKCFPTLSDEEGIPPHPITIVKNRFESDLLIKELANVDYLLKIQGDMPADEAKDLILKMKRTPSILAVIGIDIKKVKGLGLLQNL